MKARIPGRYRVPSRRQAEFDAIVAEEIAAQTAAIREEAIVYASKLSLAVIANLLIEKHGWGTGASATRLPELMADFDRVINEDGARYGYDCILEAQMMRLREHGINLHVK